MRTLNESDSDLIRDVNQILNEELLNPFTLTTKVSFTDLDGMSDFVIKAEFDMGVSRTVEETRIALRRAGTNLAIAHVAAATIEVPRLKPGLIKEFNEHLEVLNKQIEKNEDFKKALELSKAVVAVLEDLPSSSFT